MTRRRVDTAVEELSEEMLGDLDPDLRCQLWLEAIATGNDDWVDRLRETAPVYRYRGTDRAYVERAHAALQFLQYAIYDLHTTLLQHEYLDLLQRTQWVIDSLRDEDPAEEQLDRASERADQLSCLYLALYCQYHGYKEFASDTLGIELETWFALHRDGEHVLGAVEETLDDELRYDLSTEWLNDELVQARDAAADGKSEPAQLTPEEVAEVYAQDTAMLWEERLSLAP